MSCHEIYWRQIYIPHRHFYGIIQRRKSRATSKLLPPAATRFLLPPALSRRRSLRSSRSSSPSFVPSREIRVRARLSEMTTMESLIGLVNRIQRACTVLGDHGGADGGGALPTLWEALPSVAVIGGQVSSFLFLFSISLYI